jgi:plastocyanin
MSSMSATPALGPGFYITISGMAFSPLDLHVPPGATVTVINMDGIAHSVTSEASVDAFTVGSVAGVSFDTGQFTGLRSFGVGASAPNGTVVPYFCTAHRAAMATPNGSITVDSAAVAAAPPSTGVAGGGGGY